jgi:hypothetical protein
MIAANDHLLAIRPRGGHRPTHALRQAARTPAASSNATDGPRRRDPLAGARCHRTTRTPRWVAAGVTCTLVHSRVIAESSVVDRRVVQHAGAVAERVPAAVVRAGDEPVERDGHITDNQCHECFLLVRPTGPIQEAGHQRGLDIPIGDHRVELGVALVDADIHTTGQPSVAGLETVAQRLAVQARPFERQRLERDAIEFGVVGECPHDPVGGTSWKLPWKAHSVPLCA